MTNQVAVEVIEAPPISVEVIEEGGVLVVEVDQPAAVDVVEVVAPGPQGPASAFYVHTQSTASPTWTMAHNLGFTPSVALFNTGSQQIEGEVVHLNQNVCIAYFTIPIAGFARLN